MGATGEIFNNEKQVVLLLKGYVSIQLGLLINKEQTLWLSLSLSAVLSVSSSTYQKWI